ncbi:unnamed protein product [Caenorhabditis auriculariae]|uniref:Uncharacterized protein n=1 Tax=Caenorhabditis auriculariae TaxID=2777116 RepID=A0A8S1GPW6_9PELO|nr:unnamed protein product [Caenorhabditis auriculariae]
MDSDVVYKSTCYCSEPEAKQAKVIASLGKEVVFGMQLFITVFVSICFFYECSLLWALLFGSEVFLLFAILFTEPIFAELSLSLQLILLAYLLSNSYVLMLLHFKNDHFSGYARLFAKVFHITTCAQAVLCDVTVFIILYSAALLRMQISVNLLTYLKELCSNSTGASSKTSTNRFYITNNKETQPRKPSVSTISELASQVRYTEAPIFGKSFKEVLVYARYTSITRSRFVYEEKGQFGGDGRLAFEG